MKLYGLILVTALALAPHTAAAQAAMAVIADGQPWTATLPGNRTVQMTFLPDGTVDVRAGLFSPRMSWSATENGMCLTGGPGGRQCVVLEVVENGYVGRNGGDVTLLLER